MGSRPWKNSTGTHGYEQHKPPDQLNLTVIWWVIFSTLIHLYLNKSLPHILLPAGMNLFAVMCNSDAAAKRGRSQTLASSCKLVKKQFSPISIYLIMFWYEPEWNEIRANTSFV